MSVVLESREESFKVCLGKLPLLHLLSTRLLDQVLHLVHVDVSTVISINLLSEEGLKILWSAELVL